MLCNGTACICGVSFDDGCAGVGICCLDFFLRISLSCFVLEAAECRIVVSDKSLFFYFFNSIYMRKVFLLAMTAIVLAGPVFAGGSKVKKQDCTHCTKQNCTGAKCAQCCSHGKCVKG